MATSFDQIIDLALVTVDDYKLKKLWDQSEEAFQKWCDGFLVSAVPNFFRCRQPLDYDLEAREFTADLSNIEISILADFWAIEWLDREIQNSAQIQNKLQVTSAFSMHSPAQNLKEKLNLSNALREKVYQKITDYQIQDIENIIGKE